MIITYTQSDLDFISDLAHQRNDPKEAANVHSNKFDPNKSEVQSHYEGLRGELAFSLWSGLPIRTDISLGGENPGGGKWDFILPDGRTVEVRYRAKTYYEFALNDNKIESFVTDIGVLIHPGPKPWTLKMTGRCTRESFIEHCHEADFGRGPRLVIATKYLEKDNWESLMEPSDSLLAGIGL